MRILLILCYHLNIFLWDFYCVVVGLACPTLQHTHTHTKRKRAYLSFLLLSLLTICVSVPVSEKIFYTFAFFCLNMKRRKYFLVSNCMLLNFRQFSAAVHHKIIFNNITKRDAILFYKRKSTHLAA